MMLLTLLDTRYIGVAGKSHIRPHQKRTAQTEKVTSWPGAKTKLLDTTNDSFSELLMRKPTRGKQLEETLEPEPCFRHF